MLAWEVPEEDWDRLTVKVCRYKLGGREVELLGSCLPREWFLADTAAKYGPGSYKIQGGPGPYRLKNTTIHVSDAYARDAGFEPIPHGFAPAPPDPNQLMAARTAQQALTGPVDPLALAQMIQTAVDSGIAKAMSQPQQMNPMDMFFRGMETANSSMLKSLDTAKAMLGMQGLEKPEPKEKDWTDVVLELGPSILGTLQQAMATSAPRATTPAVPSARPAIAPPPVVPHSAPSQPALGDQSMQAFPDPPAEAVAILNVMKGQAFILRQYLESQTSAEALAQMLDGLVGPDLEPSILSAADHVERNGPGILGHADPAFASQKAAQVLISWARIIRESSAPDTDQP